MSDRVFLDTNILIYLYADDAPTKRALAEQVLNHNQTALSTQVLNEFSSVMLKKSKLTIPELRRAIEEITADIMVAQVTETTIIKALSIVQKYRFSYFDSLIIASALEHECSILYTEDLHHRQLIENKLTITNPFRNP